MDIKKGSEVIVSDEGKIYTSYWEMANQFIAENPKVRWLSHDDIKIVKGFEAKVMGIKQHGTYSDTMVVAITFVHGGENVFVMFGARGLKEKKSMIITNRQLSEWLLAGKGVWKIGDLINHTFGYDVKYDNAEVPEEIRIRHINHDEWLEPTQKNIM